MNSHSCKEAAVEFLTPASSGGARGIEKTRRRDVLANTALNGAGMAVGTMRLQEITTEETK